MANGEQSGSRGQDDWRIRLAGGIGATITEFQQSGSSGRIDWPFRLAGAVGAAVGGGLALLVMSLADLHLFR